MKFNYNNPIIQQVSEMYGRIQIYCMIQKIKDELKKDSIDDEYRHQLEEALEYTEKRKHTLVYEGC